MFSSWLLRELFARTAASSFQLFLLSFFLKLTPNSILCAAQWAAKPRKMPPLCKGRLVAIKPLVRVIGRRSRNTKTNCDGAW